MVTYQELDSLAAEQREQPSPTTASCKPLVIELADGTVIQFDYVGPWFWNAWYYLAGRCRRVMLFGEEIPVSDVNSYNLRLPRR